MIPGELLEIAPGDKVLDLCAAPGGKSTQLAGKLDGSGLLVLNEIVRSRFERIECPRKADNPIFVLLRQDDIKFFLTFGNRAPDAVLFRQVDFPRLCARLSSPQSSPRPGSSVRRPVRCQRPGP